MRRWGDKLNLYNNDRRNFHGSLSLEYNVLLSLAGANSNKTVQVSRWHLLPFLDMKGGSVAEKLL